MSVNFDESCGGKKRKIEKRKAVVTMVEDQQRPIAALQIVLFTFEIKQDGRNDLFETN